MAFTKSRRLAVVVGLVAVVVGIAVQAAPSKPSKTYVIGVSNTLVGNGWREEMICAVKAQAKASGIVSKVIVANRNGGPAEQIADIRNLISAGANAIIINPSSGNALNAVIAQADARGIKVVSVDQRVTAPQAHNVTNDQVAYGRLGAMWLFKKLGGSGNVVEMRGIAGVPADTDRHTGFMQALRKYPGIKVVKSTFMGWNFATAGKQMLDILNSGVQVDGVWNSGADYTVISAFKTAGKDLVPIVGADNNEFLHQMLVQYPTLQAAAVTNPAVIGGAGAAVAIKLLQGQTVRPWVKLTPLVWSMPASRKAIKANYSAKRAPTYSARLQIKPWTTYTTAQLTACKGP
ncbi:MAG: ribose transport system substrate-binding protein [Gaiellaceae bacterium]|jgi:ribose transport system substrate-binding protein|nr:ribose transport system substrate-binding protein [Gaiellaceae bacterium]